jgi:hypothetical protein
MGGSIMREAEYSYSYLWHVSESIADIWQSQSGQPVVQNIFSVGPDVVNNRVRIRLFDLSDEQIRLFRENFSDSPALAFELAPSELPWLAIDAPTFDEDAEAIYENTQEVERQFNEFGIMPSSLIEVNPGQLIRTTQADFSLGYRARNRNGVDGFVTTSHAAGISNGASVSAASGILIGHVDSFQRSGIDASFVRLNSNSTASTRIDTFGFHSPTVHDIRRGDLVTRLGSAFGFINHSVERVVDPGNTVNFGGNNVFVAETERVSGIGTRQGDSGGIIFSSTQRNVSGILVGGGNWGEMYFSPASRINSTLGLQMR